MTEAIKWQPAEARGSFYMETPIGRATVSKAADSNEWVASIDTPSGTRQSQLFVQRQEAEAWVEQQTLEGQRMGDAE